MNSDLTCNILFVPSASVDTLCHLQPGGHYMYHQVQHQRILRSARTVYLCVLSQNKHRLFPYTALTDWFYS